jgi:Trk K+ transport system NAD-binding subunit
MDKPIVLCGLGRMGWRVLDYLRTANLPVVVVDTACRPDDPRLQGVRVVSGDCRRREVLEAAGVASARGVLLITGDDLINVAAALMVRALTPDVRVVLRMFNQNLLARLGKAVHNVYALSTSLLTAPILAMTAVTGQGLGTFRLEGQADGLRQVAEITVANDSELRGQVIMDVARLRESQVVAHLPAHGTPHFLLDVDLDERLQVGDRLVVCGPPKKLARLLEKDEDGAASPFWAGRTRRFLRVVRRTLAEIDLPVTICTAVLLGVVALSTIVLHLAVTNYNLPTALFRTISIMATGAAMPEGGDLDQGWMRVFVALLRVMGAALIAAFTAIVTNYLLRARLGGALEVRRIPEGGHVVVCGLTPVGFRVTEELLGWGERVVAVDLDAGNRFVPTVRRLGAAVVIGDCTVGEVLRQAHAASAKAVVAATNNDLVNLEVALLVREQDPEQRVVLLQSDPQLAQMLREAANVHLAVSVPALAAPAFVAGLFGDRVRNVFLVRGRLLAMVDLVVGAGDAALDGQAVRAVSVDYRLLPVALVPAQGPAPQQPMQARLAAGDRLVIIVQLPDLERLLRRAPVSAAWAVEVTAFPLPARGWLAGLLRTQQGLDAAAAEAALDQLPLRLGDRLTRGQAEDLLARLLRERVSGQLCSATTEIIASRSGSAGG